MKGKSLFNINIIFFLICLAVVFLIHLGGSKIFAQEEEAIIYPQVLYSDPSPDNPFSMQATNVPLSQEITIIFTQPMDFDSVYEAFHFYQEGTDEVLNNLKYKGLLYIEGATLTFTPYPNLLEPGTTYWIKIKSTAKSAQAAPLDGDHDGVGEEGEDDDWKLMLTTVGESIISPPPPSPTPLPDKWSEVYDQKQGLSGKVTSLAIDGQAHLWVATYDPYGLYRLNGQSFEDKISSFNYSPINGFLCLAADRQGSLWVSLDTGGEQSDPNAPRLARWDKGIWQKVSAKNLGLTQDEAILKIAFDSSATAWMITSEGRVVSYNQNGQVISYPSEAIDPYAMLSDALLVDNQDNVWVGSAMLGVYKLPKGKDSWEYYYDNSFPPYTTWGISADSAGNLWIGTTIGLLKLDPSKGTPGEWTRYTMANTDQGLPSNEVGSLAVDPVRGKVWVGTSAGLAKFDGQKWTNFAKEEVSKLSDEKITALLVTPTGDLWLGTDQGLMKRDEVSPFIVNSFPANGGKIDPTERIKIIFSESMKVDTVEPAFNLMDAVKATTDSNNTKIQGEFKWSDNSTTLEFIPNNHLSAGEYTIILDTSKATDLAGNPLSAEEDEIKIKFSVQENQRSGPSFTGNENDVTLSGSGCFINSVMRHQSSASSWLRRLWEFIQHLRVYLA
ncbi:MAG: Ig-like domain-containing protein [bacterium]|nr:Ig-like domain-containing protein [bacterium]